MFESIGEILRREHPDLPTKQQGLNNLSSTLNTSLQCEICKDVGWLYPVVDGKTDYSKTERCICRKTADYERKQQAFLKRCTLPDDTEDRTFETFKCDREGKLKEALYCAHAIIEGEIKFLTLLSDVDRGKTHLAIAICRAWLADGGSAKYAFVPLLLDELRAGFKESGDHSYDSTFAFYLNVGLLVLDDLGAEKKSDWSIEKLESIIDYRYINGFPTVITTNCIMDEFTPRIRSRIQRAKMSKIVVIGSPEYRLVKQGKIK